MIIGRSWTRRDFMRAAGISGAASALMSVLPTFLSEAHAAAPPVRRLILISTGNGTFVDDWRRNGTPLQSGQALPVLDGPILAPLNAHRTKLLLLDGIDLATRYETNRNAGHGGQSNLWTGRDGDGKQAASTQLKNIYWPAGPSIDQVIADKIRGSSAFHSLQLGVLKRQIDPAGVASYAADGSPLPPELDAVATYDRIFNNFKPNSGVPDPAAERLKASKIRTLDHLRGELKRLRAELPAGDKDRLDRHEEGFIELDAQLKHVGGPSGAACVVLTRPTTPNPLAVIHAQIGLMKAAFSCDRTRVISWILTPENVWPLPADIDGWSGPDSLNGGVHTVSHLQIDANNTTAARARFQIAMLNKWCAEMIANLLTALASVEESPGVTLLDNTVVVWGMGMSNGGYHSNRGNPFVVAHGTNGPFRTNQYLRFGNFSFDNGNANKDCQAHNRLLVSLAQGFGLSDVTTFGSNKYTGPLPNLT